VNYKLIFSPKIKETIANLPHQVRSCVHEHLKLLADSPVSLSRASVTPPFPPGYQQYDFNCAHRREIHYFTLLFKYGGDEATIHCLAMVNNIRRLDDFV
jgi:hypothetical protein